MSIDTSGWTIRCAGCGEVRPFAERAAHACTNPVRLEDALGVLMAASKEKS